MPSLLGTGPGVHYMHVDVSAENVQKVNIAQCINSTAMKHLIVSFEESPDVLLVLMWMSVLMSLLLLTSVEGYLFNLYFSRTGTWWYKWLRLILGVNYVLTYILWMHLICFFNTFAATDELSCQLMCIVRCHRRVYSSFSTCNSAIHRHHLGKTKSYPGMALWEKLPLQQTC